MANADRPGFYPVGTISGAPWQGALRLMKCDAAAENIFVGDVVKLETDGYINNSVAVTDTIFGVVVNKLPITPPTPLDTLALSGNSDLNLAQQYSDGADSFLVCIAPDAIYLAESVGALTEQANIGQCANISAGAGNTTTGISGHRLGAPGGVAATSQFKVIALDTRPDNDLTAANAKVYVTVNMGFFHAPTAGI